MHFPALSPPPRFIGISDDELVCSVSFCPQALLEVIKLKEGPESFCAKSRSSSIIRCSPIAWTEEPRDPARGRSTEISRIGGGHGFQMQHDAENQWLDRHTMVSLLQEPIDLPQGKRIHVHVLLHGLEQETFLANLLLSLYGRCGAFEDAQSVFAQIQQPSIVSWNAMISAFAQHGHGEKALQFWTKMQLQGVNPTVATFLSALRACTDLKDFRQGEAIHACVIRNGYDSDVVLGTSLVNMYGACGALTEARSMFDNMNEHSLVSWNCLIAAYVQHGHAKKALDLFWQMEKEGVDPNRITLLGALRACASLSTLIEGQIIHACAVSGGLESDVAVGNSLVNMYGKCGALQDAFSVFVDLQDRDVISWTALIVACAQQGHTVKALKLFHQMIQEGMKPDAVTFASTLSACANLANLAEGEVIYGLIISHGLESNVAVGNGLINMYGKCGALEKARSVFDRMHQRDIVTWNALIAAHAQHGQSEEALRIVKTIMEQEGVKVNEVTFINVLSACSTLAEGRIIHACIFVTGHDSNSTVVTAVISMYGRFGALQDAHTMFDKMHQRTVVSWNAMITAYAQHGHGDDVFNLFQKMQWDGVKPDEVSFLGVLRACSHAGLVEEAKNCFDCMIKDHGIIPTVEHYATLIDILGRSGQLDEAQGLISNMPSDAGMWATLLGACGMHHDVEKGIWAAEHAMDLEPQKVTPYVLLSNIYAKDGRWDDAKRVRKGMVKRDIKNTPNLQH